jgi:transcriptional regulator with XRE-family HTH domain
MGLSQKESARRVRVDQSTLARWERGEREPTGELAVQAKHFLAAAESTWAALTA